MKPVNLNQLLFHPKCDTLSFYLPPQGVKALDLGSFIEDMAAQLALQRKTGLAELLEKNRQKIRKIVLGHPERSHGFYFSEHLSGYLILDCELEPFCTMGSTFHVKPVLEELFTNPEFLVVNVSLYDVKVYRGDFQHLEIVQNYDFEQLPKGFLELSSSRVFAPKYLGLLPYKTLLALKAIALRVQEMIDYHSIPVIVAGLSEVRDIFLRYFGQNGAVITGVHADFYEQTCLQVLEGVRPFRNEVLDFYSAEFRERLKRIIKARRLLADLGEIIKSTGEGKIVHLVLPTERKLWGALDFESGKYEIHRSVTSGSVDILNELAEEVMRQGGRIQFVRPHFFPQDAMVLAILRG